MLRQGRIKCRKMRRLVAHGDESGIRPDWRAKVKRYLAQLHAMVHPAEMDMPGSKWHELKGDRKGTYSVLVSGNWRVTFKWDQDGPYDVDLEDYHGR
jgi:toxin HigB-1